MERLISDLRIKLFILSEKVQRTKFDHVVNVYQKLSNNLATFINS